MDAHLLRTKIFWNLQANWHRRAQTAPETLTIPETVQGVQRLLLAEDGAMLQQTLQQAAPEPVNLEALQRLEIALYQEGLDQRVWRAQATFAHGPTRLFGIIVARAPGASSTLTSDDWRHLCTLHAQQPHYCATPYLCGTAPVGAGVTVYTVEWLEAYKELVFEIAFDGGVFLVNAHGAQRHLSPQLSRQIWQRIIAILCAYPQLRRVNVQAGDFVGQCHADGHVTLKLTTARALDLAAPPEEHLHALLRGLITASGYLSDGQQPFQRDMTQDMFLHRMQAVLQRRFGARAPALAQRQWRIFQQGGFAQQEDWLRDDCLRGTYESLCAAVPASDAWQETSRRWQAYITAVQSGRLPACWWFPPAEIITRLEQLRHYGDRTTSPHH
ncbi:MAG: hypothetical protein FJZ47_13585 [Candidatus Tectomicrobia bacterium]|uniref:Uncharacterized protein n=1 Tax=Tectimicrobiota bacterium TaxID=2528274 RepID=A0A938B4N0_UNCTE|nr:hypothetical protein [Candidatus Tectomicrobia bacterium]